MAKAILELTVEDSRALREILHIACLARGLDVAAACAHFDRLLQIAIAEAAAREKAEATIAAATAEAEAEVPKPNGDARPGAVAEFARPVDGPPGV